MTCRNKTQPIRHSHGVCLMRLAANVQLIQLQYQKLIDHTCIYGQPLSKTCTPWSRFYARHD